MRIAQRSRSPIALACAVLALSLAAAEELRAPARIVSLGEPGNCSNWTLDGYGIGMRSGEILAIRSVTVHLEGQAQVVVPGKLSGVLAFDAAHRLEKWEVKYESAEGEAVRAAMKERFGEPTSDVTGALLDDGSNTVRQRRTIWWSTPCDTAIIVYENTSVRGGPGYTVSATLARASILKKGLAEMTTLFD